MNSTGVSCVGLSLTFNGAREVMEFSITITVKTLECQCAIDRLDPQSCLTVWTDCPPLEIQTGSLARQQNSLDRPYWIGSFLPFKAQRANSKFDSLTGKRQRTIKTENAVSDKTFYHTSAIRTKSSSASKLLLPVRLRRKRHKKRMEIFPQ